MKNKIKYFLTFLILSSAVAAQPHAHKRNSYGALYFSETEVKSIQDIIGGEVVAGEDIDKTKFLETIGRYDIIHLATHTEIDNLHPLNSRFIISSLPDSTDENNSVYVSDIYPLNLNAKLATLSSCNTGGGKLAKGEGIMSLARAFKFAGCPSVVMSLWEIDDISTASIMKEFYLGLKNGMKKDVALREAKLAYLQKSNSKTAAPVFWAGAVPIGNLDELNFSAEFSTLHGVFFFSLLFLFFAVVFLILRKRNAA
ncbi:MAG: CHAT domain-containing protein [Chlorobi bacterium]|nr:CHAT domain-containing protein [Chlorobiota bacterium]